MVSCFLKKCWEIDCRALQPDGRCTLYTGSSRIRGSIIGGGGGGEYVHWPYLANVKSEIHAVVSDDKHRQRRVLTIRHAQVGNKEGRMVGGGARKGEGREGKRDVAGETSRVVESTDTYPLEDRQ